MKEFKSVMMNEAYILCTRIRYTKKHRQEQMLRRGDDVNVVRASRSGQKDGYVGFASAHAHDVRVYAATYTVKDAPSPRRPPRSMEGDLEVG